MAPIPSHKDAKEQQAFLASHLRIPASPDTAWLPSGAMPGGPPAAGITPDLGVIRCDGCASVMECGGWRGPSAAGYREHRPAWLSRWTSVIDAIKGIVVSHRYM